MSKKVTIIIPVYKVEKYLRECLDSIVNQTYKDLEIIIVDDESPDKCPKICDEYAEKDTRIHVIHKHNGGAASARNTALNQATGEYVCFVDSDDYIRNDYVEQLINHIEKYKADVAVCSFEYLYKNRREKDCFNIEAKIYDQKAYLKEFLNNWTCSLIWNKMFKRELINGIRFEEGHKIDDEFFTYKIILNANTIVQIPHILYTYRMRGSSVMNDMKSGKKRLKDQIDFLKVRYNEIKKGQPTLKRVYLEHMADNYIQFFRSELMDVEIKKYIKQAIKENLFDFIFVPYYMVLKLWIFNYYCFDVKKKYAKADTDIVLDDYYE